MIQCFPSGPFETNAYLISDATTRKAWVIDPAHGSFSRIQKQVQEFSWEIEAVCLTHSHWDHVGDAALFLDANPSIRLFVHPLDLENVLQPGSDGIDILIPFVPPDEKRISLYDTSLSVGAMRWEILHTPGHSPGSVCLFQPFQKVLFSGDTLFSGTYGNTSFSTSSKSDMIASLLMLSVLPDDVRLYPGHGEDSLLQRQKPWMQALAKRFP